MLTCIAQGLCVCGGEGGSDSPGATTSSCPDQTASPFSARVRPCVAQAPRVLDSRRYSLPSDKASILIDVCHRDKTSSRPQLIAERTLCTAEQLMRQEEKPFGKLLEDVPSFLRDTLRMQEILYTLRKVSVPQY